MRAEYVLDFGDSTISEPAIVTQVSDIHVSQEDPTRLSDFLLFSQRILYPLKPGYVLLTGDLTHSKRQSSVRGQQNESEWEGYSAAVESLVQDAAVPRLSVLDIRGNHDTFDVGSVGTSTDFFSAYSSHGTRGLGGERVFVNAVRRPGSAEGAGSCPLVLLVGIDATPALKLRTPINFSGVATQSLMARLDAALRDERARLPSGCEPSAVAYLHYPLSMVRYPEGAYEGSSGRPERLPEILARHGVRAVLNGHLHAALGERLHAVHRVRGRDLAELEAASWKYERRFRVLTADRAALSFVDLEFRSGGVSGEGGCKCAGAPHGRARQGADAGVVPVDPSRCVGAWLVAVTSPPDWRYFAPLPGEPSPWGGAVRAAALPLRREEGLEPASAQACWLCAASARDIGAARLLGCDPMARSGGNATGAAIFGGPFSSPPCDGVLLLQVTVCGEAGGGEQQCSCSERRPVAPPGRTGASPAARPPVPAGWLERAVLAADWPRVIGVAMAGLGLLHLATVLVLPAIAPKPLDAKAAVGGASRRSLPVRAAGILVSLLRLPARAAALHPRVWACQAIYASWLLIGPWAAGTLSRHHPAGLFGLWGVILPAPEIPDGCRAAWLTGWAWCPNPDVFFFIVPQYVLLHFPATFWIGAALGLAGPRPVAPSRLLALWCSTWRWILLVSSGVVLLWVYIASCLRIYADLGLAALMLSPGVSWSAPVLIAALAFARTSPHSHGRKGE